MGKNYIKHLLALMLLVCSTATFAQATSTVSASFDGATMLVNITNPDYPFTAIQFDLELPEGIEVDFDGEYYAVDLGSRTNSRKHSYPECAIQPDGSLRVVIISMSNALYNGTEGDVATAALKVNGAADGNYQFTIKNVVLSDPSSSNEKLEPYTGWVAVEGGAVVGAGEEPVVPDYSAEIAALRALVAEAQATHDAAVEGTANGEYPAGAKAALQAVITEVNGKISDTMTLDEINACTAQINAAVTEFEGKVITNAGGDEGDDVAVASTVSASFDGATMLVNITNPDYPFSAIQFDLELPEGIEVDFDGEYYTVDLGSRTNSRKHSYPECAIQPDGSLRVVIVSMSNALYNGTEGDVATAALKVNGAADGDYQFTIKNVVLSAPGSNEKLEPYTGWVAVEGGVVVGAGEGDDVAVASTVSASFDGATMLVNITNPNYPFSAIQFDLELPEGIEVDFDGEYYTVDLGSRTNSRKHSYPECAIQPDGSLRVVIISMSNALYNGTEGDVATAALKVNGAADGDYQFTIKNVVLSAPGSNEKLEPYTGWVAVEGGVVVGAGEEPVAPDYSAEIAALRTLVAEAQATHDAAVEGTANGEYPAGAKAALQAVITEVNGKISDTMTLDEINACTAQINAAVTEFEGKVITNAGEFSLSVTSDVIVKSGKQITLSVAIDNSAEILAFGFDLYLPAGVSVATDENGRAMISKSGRIEDHTISSNNLTGFTRIACVSMEGYTILENSGEVMTIVLDVTTDAADGYNTIEIKDIELSDVNSNPINPASATTDIYVYSYILGDVNDDAKYTITDASQALNLYLTAAEAASKPAADYNCDGKITITDVTAILNLYLTGKTPTVVLPEKQAAKKAFARNTIADNTLYIEPFTIKPGEEKEVFIRLNSTQDYLACGVDLILPEGITIATNSRGRYIVTPGTRTIDHTVSVNYLEDRKAYRIACIDMVYNDPFGGESGEDLIVVTLKAAEDVQYGTYEVKLTEMELTTTAQEAVNPETFISSVTVEKDNNIVVVADNTLYIEPFSIKPGEEKEVLVRLNSTQDYLACGVDLILPEGITIATNSRGRYIVTPGTRTIDHTVSVNYLEDRKAYRIACIDMVYNDPFGGESGEDLIVITLKAAEDAVTGVYEFKLTEMELTTTAQEAVNPDTFIGEVTIEGDENGIEDILAEGAEGNAAIYDLTGRAVKEATTPGIYIVGGKKIFVK